MSSALWELYFGPEAIPVELLGYKVFEIRNQWGSTGGESTVGMDEKQILPHSAI